MGGVGCVFRCWMLKVLFFLYKIYFMRFFFHDMFLNRKRVFAFFGRGEHIGFMFTGSIYPVGSDEEGT